jgi:hypothetical protein
MRLKAIYGVVHLFCRHLDHRAHRYRYLLAVEHEMIPYLASLYV